MTQVEPQMLGKLIRDAGIDNDKVASLEEYQMLSAEIIH